MTPPLRFVLGPGRDPERLAKILLMHPPCPLACRHPVVALHHEDPDAIVLVDEAAGRLESHRAGERHAECFVLDAAVLVVDGGLDDLVGGTGAVPEGKRPAVVEYRQFLLRPGQREPDPLLAGQKRPLGELSDDGEQFVVRKLPVPGRVPPYPTPIPGEYLRSKISSPPQGSLDWCTLKSAGGSFIRPCQRTILPYDRGRFLPLQGEFGSRMTIRETFDSWKRASRWRQLTADS